MDMDTGGAATIASFVNAAVGVGAASRVSSKKVEKL